MVFEQELPFSQACENNKAPILAVLAQAFASSQQVLEIGAGTGQHAVYFAAALPHLVWQMSDQMQNLPHLAIRAERALLPNLPAPLHYDVTQQPPAATYDAIFTANTLHIMSWQAVLLFFQQLLSITTKNATLCIYGPFNYQGQFTSASNQSFDQSLKSRNPTMGIRDAEKVILLAEQAGFCLWQDCAMPANNRLLWFTKPN